MKKYTERIRDLREDHDLKQSDIAKLLQTTQQVYSRYEQGINEMPVRHLVVLARFYGVSLDYIMGETDIKERYPESK
ncbi:MAG: helix-turn-helix domain-containing protein [Eubacteriales bacterium]